MAITTMAYSVWRSCLGSALRTACACVLVGYVTIYGPDALRLHLNFPAFSYVTVILIIGEATLGDTLHRVVQALYGITLSTLLAFLTLFFIDEHASIGLKSTALALSSFIVAFPESMSLITVRVALGQTVLVHLASHTHGGPVNVAVSTAVGAAAAVIAIVLPYPRFAYYEVKEKSWLFTDIVLERIRLLVNSFFSSASSQATAMTPILSLRTVSTKLLQSIKLKQVNVQWERPLLMFLNAGDISSNGMESTEMALKGMEAALTSMASVPSEVLNQQPLRSNVLILGDQTCLIVKQYNFMTEKDMVNKTLESLRHIPLNLENLPVFFFLFCMKILHDGPLMNTENSSREEPQKLRNNKWIMSVMNIERILTALKCSITLGLSALFGFLFNREYGYWCALTVAITITPWREATFKLANIRIQGAALGSVYGVLIGSTITEDLMQVRLLLLIPFIVFTSFLHKSRMYGQAGAVAAIISAMVILGRRRYGSTSTFAVVRLTEIFIGLLCSTIVELLLQPRRASTVARVQLSSSIQTLHDSMMQKKEKKLREQVNKLRKDIGEAEGEPNFWLPPFPVACYNKLQISLSKMVDLLHFLVPAMEVLAQETHESLEAISEDVEHLRNLISDSLKFFSVEKEENDSSDLEMGSGVGSLEFEKVVASFVQHGREAMEKLEGDHVDEVVKGQVFLSLGAIGFCLQGLQKETIELKNGLLELLQSENPGRHNDFK